MSKWLLGTLFLTLLGNVLGLFVLYKAMDYRKKMILAWAQSHEWVSEYNRSKPLDMSVQPPELVFLGASITAHWDLDKYFPGKNYVNKGIDGQFSGQLLLRFQHDVVDLNSQMVLIKLCEMNFAHEVPFEISRDNVKMLVNLAKTNGIRPLLATTIPVTNPINKGQGDRSINGQIAFYNRWILDFARQMRMDVIDLAHAMSDDEGNLRPELTYDGVHPNDAGYSVMATELTNFLTKEEH